MLMYKEVKIFLEILNFVRIYQRFLSKIARILVRIAYCVMRIV